MFKPTKLLKIVAVLFIITGILGMFGTAVSYIMLPKMREIPGIDMSTIEAALTPLNLIMSVISCICSIAAGIFGLSGRSKRGAVVCAGIYLALVLVFKWCLKGHLLYLWQWILSCRYCICGAYISRNDCCYWNHSRSMFLAINPFLAAATCCMIGMQSVK